MFYPWHDFFYLIGGASASLIGLLFVVTSLTSGLETDNTTQGAKLYLTPTCGHFGMVLMTSAVALAPALAATVVGGLVTAMALAGLYYSAWVALSLRSGKAPEAPHWSDLWYYGVAPAVVYLWIGAAGVGLARLGGPAIYGLAAGLLLLMALSLRNAWDLITWIAPRSKTVVKRD